MLKVIGTANLVADPTTGTAAGTPFTSFRVASNSRRKGADGNPIASFFEVTCFTSAREPCAKYLHKGDKVHISGDLVLRPYVDKDGVKKISPEINLNDIEFLTPKKDGQVSEAHEQAPVANSASTPTADELPF